MYDAPVVIMMPHVFIMRFDRPIMMLHMLIMMLHLHIAMLNQHTSDHDDARVYHWKDVLGEGKFRREQVLNVEYLEFHQMLLHVTHME